MCPLCNDTVVLTIAHLLVFCATCHVHRADVFLLHVCSLCNLYRLRVSCGSGDINGCGTRWAASFVTVRQQNTCHNGWHGGKSGAGGGDGGHAERETQCPQKPRGAGALVESDGGAPPAPARTRSFLSC